MKKKVIIIFALLSVVLNVSAQSFYSFKKWGSLIKFDANEVVIAVTPASTEMGMEFLMKVAGRTKTAISSADIETRLTTQPDTLIFSLTHITH